MILNIISKQNKIRVVQKTLQRIRGKGAVLANKIYNNYKIIFKTITEVDQWNEIKKKKEKKMTQVHVLSVP